MIILAESCAASSTASAAQKAQKKAAYPSWNRDICTISPRYTICGPPKTHWYCDGENNCCTSPNMLPSCQPPPDRWAQFARPGHATDLPALVAKQPRWHGAVSRPNIGPACGGIITDLAEIFRANRARSARQARPSARFSSPDPRCPMARRRLRSTPGRRSARCADPARSCSSRMGQFAWFAHA
jgi:hypothetical protein